MIINIHLYSIHLYVKINIEVMIIMFGDNLKYLRKKHGMNTIVLGEKLNLAPSTIGMYEQNRREPNFKKLKEISNIFNVSIDYLLDNDVNFTEETCEHEVWFKRLNDADKVKLKEIWQITIK